MAADGVDLVDEDDGGGVLLGLVEQVAHARSPDSDEHFDEVRSADREERHIRFAGYRFGEQRLAGSRRAHQQRALRNLASQIAVLAGILQKIDDLHDLDLGLLQSGHVLERDRHVRVLVEHLGLGFAHVEYAAARTAAPAARHAAPQEPPDREKDQDRENQRERVAPHIAPRLERQRNGKIALAQRILEVVLEIVQRADIERELGPLGRKALVVLLPRVLGYLVGLQVNLGGLLVDDDDLLHVALLDHRLDAVPIGGMRHFAAAEQPP